MFLKNYLFKILPINDKFLQNLLSFFIVMFIYFLYCNVLLFAVGRNLELFSKERIPWNIIFEPILSVVSEFDYLCQAIPP